MLPESPSRYNPARDCEEKDRLAAKFWELLRRHPGLRRCAQRLLGTSMRPFGEHEGFAVVARFLRRLDLHNPLAGFILRWLFKPGRIEFSYPRQPEEFHTRWNERSFLESGYPWIDEDKLDELEELITAETDGDAYPGPLKLEGGPFTFDTPWPETPELFQFLFRWLALDYGFDVFNREAYPESGWYLVSGAVRRDPNWVFLDLRAKDLHVSSVEKLRRFKFFFERHHVYALPRLVSRQRTRQLIMEDFERFLDEVVAGEKEMIATNKLPHLFGTETAWDVFTFCYPEIHYEYVGSGRGFAGSYPFLRSGSSRAFEYLIALRQREGKWSPTSDMNAHVQQHYEHLERLMYATFPRFEFAAMLKLEDPALSDNAVALSNEYAVCGSLFRLQCLHGPYALGLLMR